MTANLKKLHCEYLQHLEKEYGSVKKDIKPITLYNLKRQLDGSYITTAIIELDGEGIAKVGMKEYPVSVQPQEGHLVISGLEEHEEHEIKRIYVYMNQTVMLEKLIEEFTRYEPNDVSKSLFESEVKIKCKQKLVIEGLNEMQTKVVCAGLMESLLVVGPAGAGKTKTIVELIKRYIENGKRVLVASNANLAVENVFENLIQKIELEKDQIVVGIKTDMEVLQEYAPKKILEQKVFELKDEEEILEEAKITLAKMKQELLVLIEPIETQISMSENLVASLEKDVAICKSDIRRFEGLLKDYENRLKKINDNVFLSAMMTLVNSQKTDELRNNITETTKLIEHKKLSCTKIEERILEINKTSGEAKESIEERKMKLQEALAQEEICKSRLKEIREEIMNVSKRNIFKDAKVAGVTLMSCAINKKIKEADFDVLIVDEGSMATIPMLLLAINCVKEIAVIFGDPTQLSPVAKIDELKKSVYDILGVSESFRNGEMHDKTLMLDTQYRCHPRIASVVSDMFYGGMLKNGKVVEGNKSPMAIKNTNKYPPHYRPDNGSYVNVINRNIAMEYTKLALERGQRSIAVITPFKGQSNIIQNMYDELFADEYPDADFKAATIHSFQGKEKDFIIFDLTFGKSLNRGLGIPKMLQGEKGSEASKLLNVAMTRAKDFFIVIADLEYTYQTLLEMPNGEDQILFQWLKRLEMELN